MAGALEGDIFVGPKAEEHRGLLVINYPMEHGIVTDKSDMERIWQDVYSKDLLQTFAEERPSIRAGTEKSAVLADILHQLSSRSRSGMVWYRGQVQGGKGHQQATGTGPAAKSTMFTGAKRQQKRKLSEAEEDDFTSSNGHSGSEGKTAIPSVNWVNLRKPGYRNHHGGATGRQKSFTFNKLLSTCGISTIVAFVAYYGYLGYLETRISTPLQVDK
ncbi:Alpha-centractin, partial [Folsomia candida]